MSGLSSSAAPSPASHIQISGISKSFGGESDQVVALKDVDLNVRMGEFLTILGPSGCGKSTLLMIIAGLIPPTTGTVRAASVEVSGPLTDVGIVFQQDLLFDWRTALGNVMLQADIRGLEKSPARAKAITLLEQVGLKGFEDRRPWELSGGMRQRTALCRALLHDASILLLDEPFGALDALTRDQIGLDLLKIWTALRPTAILVTHSISEAIFLSDRVVVMSSRPGRILMEVDIELPRPRTAEMRDSLPFLAYQSKLRSVIGN